MFCISISFKKVPLDIRQQFAFSKEEAIACLKELKDHHVISGGVVVSTCNRSEIYFTTEQQTEENDKIEQVERTLVEYKQVSLTLIRKFGMYYADRKAIKHLFKVTCGLDSMVLGEDEILHQVKEAYLSANSEGYTNSEINIIFQGAFNCAKLSKSSTRLSQTPLSIGTLTANAIEEYLRSKKNGMQSVGKVLVIGATGKIGSVVAKDLLAKGIKVLGTKRMHSGKEGIFFSDDMEWVDFKDRYQYISQIDAVVSATSSPHYTLTMEEFQLYRGDTEDKLLVDLAVPYDIDKEICRLSGITRYDVDYFKTVSKENRNIRQGELEKVQQIIEDCVEDVRKKLYLREFKDKMRSEDKEEWFYKMTYYLKDVLDSEQFGDVLSRICEKEKDC